MKTKWMKRVIAGLAATLMLGVSMIGSVSAADWDVKRGDVDYSVEFNGASEVFLCNEGTLGSKVGTEIYLTYTVESMEFTEKYANIGFIGTNQPGARWPYVASADGKGGGFYQFSNENIFMVEGNTYFFKLTITEDGYTYRGGWAKDEDAEYIKLTATTGEVKKDSEYYGLYLNAYGIKGKLTRVRFYDKNGNNLGVRARTTTGTVNIGREEVFKKDTQVDHRYTLEFKDAFDLAISNKKLATSNKVYMEYKVKSASGKVYQTATVLTNEPKTTYPYLNGFMKHQSFQPTDENLTTGALLVEGAEYLIIFEKQATRLDVVIQRTLNGETTNFSLGSPYGTYNKDMNYFCLWFGGTREGLRVSAVLENFKIYDSNKNNLGVQFNKDGVSTQHFGEMEDYAGCEALYACQEDGALIALYANKTLKFTKDGATTEGTYAIKDGVITMKIAGKETKGEYTFQYIKDGDGKEYRRVHTCKVNFETGKGSKVESQVLNEKNGYQVMRPTDPTLEGKEFEGWYTKDGKEFDFEQVVTKSITLYAKWSGEKWEVPATEDVTGTKLGEVNPILYIAGCAFIVVAATVCGVIIIKRGKRHAKNN